MRSLQVRLMTGTMAGTVILLSIAGVVIYDLMRSTLLADFDLSLLTRAQALASLVEEDGGTIEAEFSERHLPEFSRRDRPDYYELRNTDGRSLFRSPSLADRQLKPVATTGDFPIFQPIVLPDGRAGRLVVLAFHPKSESQRDEEGEHRGPGKNVGQGNRLLTLCMARDTADLEQTLARTRMLLICVCGFATLATCLFLAFVVRTGLRPLRELAHRIEGLDETALATPIEVRGTPAELAPVVERLNDLLLHLGLSRGRRLRLDLCSWNVQKTHGKSHHQPKYQDIPTAFHGFTFLQIRPNDALSIPSTAAWCSCATWFHRLRPRRG